MSNDTAFLCSDLQGSFKCISVGLQQHLAHSISDSAIVLTTAQKSIHLHRDQPLQTGNMQNMKMTD